MPAPTARWTEGIAQALLDPTVCPRCASVLVRVGGCEVCSADLSGPAGAQVWEASVSAAQALRHRDSLVASLPLVPTPSAAAPLPARAAVVADGPRAERPDAPVVASSPSRSIAEDTAAGFSVQSLLAIAGAGLFAAAAVVFTFLNPDLTDPVARGSIVAVIAAVFGAGAWLLGRAGLRLSAEVVGALGAVLWGLDLASTTSAFAPSGSWWTVFGTAVGATSLALLVLAALLRLRTFLWLGAVGLTLAPALASYSADHSAVVALGHIASLLTGTAVLALLARLTSRFGSAAAPERGAVALLQAGAALAGFIGALVTAVPPGSLITAALLLLALAAAALVATLQGFRVWWSAVVGVTTATAASLVAIEIAGLDTPWLALTAPLGALVGAALVDRVPWRAPVDRWTVVVAAGSTAAALALPGLAFTLIAALDPLVRLGSGYTGATAAGADPVSTSAALLACGAMALAIALLARRAHHEGKAAEVRPFAVLAFWVLVPAVLAAAVWSIWPVPVSVGLALGLALLLSLAATRGARGTVGNAARVPAAVGAHLAVVLAAIVSWIDGTEGAVLAGIPIAIVLVAVARTVPVEARPVHLAAGYAYLLSLTAAALSLTALPDIAILCLTVSAGALVALGATVVDRVPVRHWFAILIVTAVPFLIGVASLLVIRSGWTALSTGITFALALTLLLTRRPGLSLLVRSLAAAILVPSIAVVAVSLGAELLESSGSPVVLPVIAVVVAAVLGGIGPIGASLAKRRSSDATRRLTPERAIEVSTLVTGALTVLLALVRVAAGLETALVVLLLIGAGGALARVLSGRSYGWWLAGAAWTASLWTVWGLLGVEAPEPYYLPTALVLVAVGAIRLLLRRGGRTMVITGLTASVLPTVVLLAVLGDGYPEFPARTSGLLVGAALTTALALRVRRSETSLETSGFRLVLLSLAALAAAAGAVRAVRWGAGLDPRPDGIALMAAVVGVSAVSVLLFLVIGRAVGGLLSAHPPASAGVGAIGSLPALLRRLAAVRGLLVAALLASAVGPITAVRDDWGAIWTLWVLALILLAVFVASAARSLRGPTLLPPPWLVYAVAWVTGVAGWSPRELRVEWFSLPLGVAVLIAGIIAFIALERPAAGHHGEGRPLAGSWPVGHTGSRRLLGPGIVLTLLPSVLATGTDPQTWRAILVIALALAAILIGSTLRLAAPFLLGLIVLPIENVVVFAVQIGRNIGALPWWITLATAGIVLLALAVSSERKTSRGGGVGARIRELR